MSTSTIARRVGHAGARRDPAPSAAPARVGRAVAMLVAVGIVGAAGAGLAVAVPLLQHPGEQAARAALVDPASGSLTIGQHVRTGFGSVTVTEATINNGLNADELGGMSHGVSSLVGSGKAQVDVVVNLSNDSSAVLHVSATQFALVTGRGDVPTGAPVPATGTTLTTGSVPTHAAVDARVSFVTATDGSRLWVLFTDPSTGQVLQVPLGRAATVAAEHPHAGHGGAPLPVPADTHDDH